MVILPFGAARGVRTQQDGHVVSVRRASPWRYQRPGGEAL